MPSWWKATSVSSSEVPGPAVSGGGRRRLGHEQRAAHRILVGQRRPGASRMRSARARASSVPLAAWWMAASTSCTLRPGRTTSERTTSGSMGMGRSSSTVMRATAIATPSGASARSTARASRADGGPPCMAVGSHGPRARAVGTSVSPSGTKMAVHSVLEIEELVGQPGQVIGERRRGRARRSGSTTNLEKSTSTKASMRSRSAAMPLGTSTEGSARSARRLPRALSTASGTAPRA